MSHTATPIRLLLAEDSLDDFALVTRAIRNAGFDLQYQRVDQPEDFAAALRDGDWDAIISDHAMPHFSSAAALELLRRDGRDLPFIVVSGTIDEETAVTILRAGAHDFITKQNLARLGHALKRELKEAQNRSQHRAAQEDLRRQRDFLRLVIDASPNLIYVKNQQGQFVLANQATADLYGTTVENLATEVPHQGEMLSTPSNRVEAITDRRTGEIRWFEALSVPLQEEGQPPTRLVIATDITERKRTADTLRATEAQLMHSQKMEAVGQLAGGIAHDFNNLLTVILGFSQMLQDRLRDQPQFEADIDQIVKSGERASLLTRQLLTFSRKQVIEPQTISLNTIIYELDKMLRRVIGEDMQLQLALAPSLSFVRADPSQIEQVIMNLAVNARDAMPMGGELTIETGDTTRPRGLEVDPSGEPLPERFVQLSVRDTGTGIPPDVQARIFEPFFTTKAPGKGTGLGLSTVYGIVKQSGGYLTVDSVVGQGTTFTIYLPAVAAPSVPAIAADVRDAHLRGDETVLLVEDEAAVRQLIQRALLRYGYRVLSAASAAEAIIVAREFSGPIDLLVTDIVMPDVRGPALAKTLRAARPIGAVLYMSGFTDRPGGEVGPLEPESSFLHKPFTPDRLAAKVRECLNRRSGGR